MLKLDFNFELPLVYQAILILLKVWTKASIDTDARQFVTFDLWLTIYRLLQSETISCEGISFPGIVFQLFIPWSGVLIQDRSASLWGLCEVSVRHLFAASRELGASQTDVWSPSHHRDLAAFQVEPFSLSLCNPATPPTPWRALHRQIRKYINFCEFKIYKNLILKSSCLASSPNERLSFFLISFVTFCVLLFHNHSCSLKSTRVPFSFICLLCFLSIPNLELLRNHLNIVSSPVWAAWWEYDENTARTQRNPGVTALKMRPIDAYSAQLPFYKWKFAICRRRKRFCILCRKDSPDQPQTTRRDQSKHPVLKRQC